MGAGCLEEEGYWGGAGVEGYGDVGGEGLAGGEGVLGLSVGGDGVGADDDGRGSGVRLLGRWRRDR